MKALREIIEEIKSYQLAMGYDYTTMSSEDKMQALRNYVVALMMEQAEMLEEVSWKPWRTHDSQKPNPNKRKVALEWVDCLFFLVDQMFSLDLEPDDILSAYETKLAANHKRIANGYSKLKT